MTALIELSVGMWIAIYLRMNNSQGHGFLSRRLEEWIGTVQPVEEAVAASGRMLWNPRTNDMAWSLGFRNILGIDEKTETSLDVFFSRIRADSLNNIREMIRMAPTLKTQMTAWFHLRGTDKENHLIVITVFREKIDSEGLSLARVFIQDLTQLSFIHEEAYEMFDLKSN